MSFRPTAFSALLARSSPLLRQPMCTPLALRPLRPASARFLHTPSRPAAAVARAVPFPKAQVQSARYGMYAVLALGLGTAYWSQVRSQRPLACASPSDASPRPEVGGGQPKSEFSAYELSFGAVCGICSGVFIKKGLRAIAFMLGGVFILMQYLSSKSFISIDWGKVAGKYDSVLGTKTSDGKIRPPSAGGVWAWFVDFLTANFQQRASFLAGLVLGLRLG